MAYTQSFTPGVGYTVNPIPPSNGTWQFANLAAFPTVGAAGLTYVAKDTDTAYYWDDVASAYVAFSGGMPTTSAGVAGAVSDETGTGALVFANAPTLVNPVVGTQSAGDNTTKAASTAYVDAAVSSGGSPAVVLGAGPTNITQSGHTNRPVSSSYATPTSVVFAGTATSGAVDGGLVSIDNLGAGIMTADGAIEAPPGFKRWAAKGESIIAIYNAAADKYYSKTPDIRKSGQEVSWAYVPENNATTFGRLGVGVHSVADSGALAAVNAAGTTRYTRMVKVAMNSAAATAGEFPGLYWAGTTGAVHIPTAAQINGFKFRIVGSINDAIAAGYFGMGFQNGVPTAAEPSTLTNCIMLAGDSTDANMQIMHNDNAGACTKVNLGASFPNHTNAADMYELTVDFYSDGVARHCFWVARNLITLAEAQGEITSELPVAGALILPFIFRGNNATATTCSFHFCGAFAGAYA